MRGSYSVWTGFNFAREMIVWLPPFETCHRILQLLNKLMAMFINGNEQRYKEKGGGGRVGGGGLSLFGVRS